MAIAVGFLVGGAVLKLGNGTSVIFGVVGAVFALLGCVLGNFFSIIGMIANEASLGYLDVLFQFNWALLPELVEATFSPIDLLFYGIAGGRDLASQ